MARSAITAITDDLIDDSGSVLWSLIQGEQLEFPIVLNFVAVATSDYTYEAVVIEALNEDGATTVPTRARPSGVQTTLAVRVPTFKGVWDPAIQFFREDVVLYDNVYYRLDRSIYTLSSLPSAGSPWVVHNPGTVYLQIPASLSVLPAWAIQPSITSPVYGYLELRITEPGGGVYQRTWKPVRGMVQLRYSPTANVPDA